MRESKNGFPKYVATCLVWLIVASLFLSRQLASAPQNPNRYPMEPIFVEPGLRELAQSRTSMVTTPHPFATEAGLEMLRQGGNAVDAAVASAMVVAVIDTGLTSLAGGGELTFYNAKTKKTTVINFEPNAVREDVKPYNRERDNLTGRSIRIPGSFAGFHLAIQKYGSLPWKQIVEPAIFYAENGFPIHGDAYSSMHRNYSTLTLLPGGRAMFAPNGFLPAVGSIFKQPDMAETLKQIAAHGPEFFYRGPFAEQMVKAIREVGGKATLEDFASYRPVEREPVRGTYKDYQIVGPPLPSSGVTGIIEAMQILENVDLKGLGHYSESADSLQWLIEVLQTTFQDAQRYSGVPELDRALAQVYTSKEYARSRYEVIRHKIEQMKRQAPETKDVPRTLPAREDLRENVPSDGTNNVAVVDKDGNVCSMIHTIYGTVYSYAGLFVGGIVMNASGGFPALPGGRIISEMPATIVFKGDKPYFAVGSSSGIPNPFFLIVNILGWDKNFKEAQEAPRFRTDVTRMGNAGVMNKIRIEHRIEAKVIEELKRRGYQVEWAAPYSMRNSQLAGVDPDTGMRYGAPDPRGLGLAKGQ